MALHIHNTDNVSDDATLELDGAAGVTTAVVGGTTYLFVTGNFDNGVSAFALDGNVPLLGDVLWRHSDGTAATAAQELGSLPNTWQIDGTGDFDGDGDADVLWRHDDGQTVTWETQNGAFVASHDGSRAPGISTATVTPTSSGATATARW